MFRYILLLALLYQVSVHAQTTLSAGDIAIIHYNSDNPDEFSFLCLRGIDSGTQIYFTDNGWLSSGAFRNSEGTLDWKAQKSYSCGDVVLVDSLGNISLSASGDQLFAYQGSASSPSFVTAFNNEDTAVWQSTATSASTSALPSSLTNGVNAIAIYEIDNAVYKDSASGSLSYFKSRIFQDSLFSGHNSTRQSFASSVNISSGCVLPVHWLDLAIEQKNELTELVWSTASELNCSRYEVQFSKNGMEFETIGMVFGHGTSDQINEYRYALVGQVGYYRLRQVDFDGSFDLSKHIFFDADDRWVSLVKSSDHYLLKTKGGFKVLVRDASGREVLQLLSVDEAKVNTVSLPLGLYYLEVLKERKKQVFKLVHY